VQKADKIRAGYLSRARGARSIRTDARACARKSERRRIHLPPYDIGIRFFLPLHDRRLLVVAVCVPTAPFSMSVIGSVLFGTSHVARVTISRPREKELAQIWENRWSRVVETRIPFYLLFSFSFVSLPFPAKRASCRARAECCHPFYVSRAPRFRARCCTREGRSRGDLEEPVFAHRWFHVWNRERPERFSLRCETHRKSALEKWRKSVSIRSRFEHRRASKPSRAPSFRSLARSLARSLVLFLPLAFHRRAYAVHLLDESPQSR